MLEVEDMVEGKEHANFGVVLTLTSPNSDIKGSGNLGWAQQFGVSLHRNVKNVRFTANYAT